MHIKEVIARFRSWQKTPRSYSYQDLGNHCCSNCGYEFNGNFCPICGQNFSDDRITWRSVWQGITRIWNMDSRSLPTTLWQLLWRPGYLIRDYISGHKQVCHPPTNTLFAVAIIYVIIMHLLGSENNVSVVGDGVAPVFVYLLTWLSEHPAWGMMTATMAMIIPTWILFHYAPHYTHHTLPESIFIQLFMSTLMLICILLAELSERFLHIEFIVLLIPLYYYIAYRQLFGYRFWSTFWRILVCAIVWVFILCFFAIILFIPGNPTGGPPLALLGAGLIFLAFSAAILAVGFWISRKTSKSSSPHDTQQKKIFTYKKQYNNDSSC
ncbi:MAG: DUF3667 domain-containing protein [Bacteroidales bacterium]|nr:DUF3667 domain-containing protein [Bacteroidales bacterium]